MIRALRRQHAQKTAARLVDCGEQAGVLYDGGYNCAQAVLQAATGRNDPELLAVAKAFGGGIGKSGCLCGAVSGGVMALGLLGKAELGGELVSGFRSEFRSTCCRALSKDYQWLSREHKANCRKLTVAAAGMVGQLLGK